MSATFPATGAVPPSQRRVVLDTNIWLSAALSPAGAPARLVAKVLADDIAVFSEATFAEIESRIWKPKFDRYLSMAARQGVLHDAKAAAYWVDPPGDIAAIRHCRDADDDKFIHAALAASAGWLVSGDEHLLVLDGKVGVRIVTAADALTLDGFCR